MEKSVTIDTWLGQVDIDLSVASCPVCGSMLRETDQDTLICPWNLCPYRQDVGARYEEGI